MKELFKHQKNSDCGLLQEIILLVRIAQHTWEDNNQKIHEIQRGVIINQISTPENRNDMIWIPV